MVPVAQSNQRPIGQIASELLWNSLPKHWDGQQCVLDMKHGGSNNWRQTEWIGFWFQFKALAILKSLGGTIGPRFGRVEFDLSLQGTWDLKCHAQGNRPWAPLNDEMAVESCLRSTKQFGFLIAIGEATYDSSGAFRCWHSKLKGPPSDYVLAGLQSGRRHRRYKITFDLTSIVWVEFSSSVEIQEAIDQGWFRRGMQKGQQNSNGKPREPKFGFSPTRWRAYHDGIAGGSAP